MLFIHGQVPSKGWADGIYSHPPDAPLAGSPHTPQAHRVPAELTDFVLEPASCLPPVSEFVSPPEQGPGVALGYLLLLHCPQ